MMPDVVDHFSVGEIRLFFSTALDVIRKYGRDYEYVEVTDRVFWIQYKWIGLSFLCGDYAYNDSISFYEFYVIEIEIYKPSKLATSKGINLFSSRLFDVIDAYGLPLSANSYKSEREKVTQNYLGLRFVFKRKHFDAPWKTDESLDEPVDVIVVSEECNEVHMESRYQNTWIDRWLRFCRYMRASEWGLLADGSLVYPQMHLFRYVMEGSAESYKALDVPGFWHETSRVFPADIATYDYWGDAPLISHKPVFLQALPQNVRFQDLTVDQYSSQKSINLEMEMYFDFERKRLIDVKRRIIEKNIDIFSTDVGPPSSVL